MIVAYCDGGAIPNPGRCYGSFKVYKDRQLEAWTKQEFDHGTNNQAEYWALIHLLNYLVNKGCTKAVINMDSMLVIKQVKGEYQVRQSGLIPLHDKVLKLLSKFNDVEFRHINNKKMKKVLGH